MSYQLRDLGVSAAAEEFYLRLLREGPGAGDAEPVTELVRLGLIRIGDGGRVHPLPPRSAVEAWAAERELEAARAREGAELLAQLYAARTGAAPTFVDVVERAQDILDLFESMQSGAREQLRALDRGSYLSHDKPNPPQAQLDAMARGVAYRVVYESNLLQTQEGFRSMRDSVEAGEAARAFPGLPLKLFIADATRALVVLPAESREEVVALLVHPSVLLDALAELFEAFWRLAVPVAGEGVADGGEEPSPATRRLLALLSAGATDEAIARDLGVSDRTVYRRISRLQVLLGAQTRFQLGVQASRRNWL